MIWREGSVSFSGSFLPRIRARRVKRKSKTSTAPAGEESEASESTRRMICALSEETRRSLPIEAPRHEQIEYQNCSGIFKS